MSEQVVEQQVVEQRGIAVAVVVHDGMVLLVRRAEAEGDLLWQFPAGAIEEGESVSEAAERETYEETGLSVDAILLLGERVHPASGRYLSYVVCELVTGEAHVADAEELAEVAWVTHADLPAHVPGGLFGPVQEYLDGHLPHEP
ncbi:8-oxo-dGTP diphosphatase [Streptacidiphilus sp. MAP12-33]|uniref:NUDIX hydrolase n=1 Tax=Streptacidiphilus sp. MAP12-33 TaxID=3156266 RepID=UPI003511731F